MAPLGNRPGLILRTWEGVRTEGLRRHLRLMTRHRDRAGKWYFFRICEARTAGAL
ncbi:hypothetical protein [Jannaschia rubra]|uniref:hypothetical protein n=1 Tax=Jannaschia rubra TaxID=282197 RepID=UPI0024916AC3|nr:hypothetical protein [Jannaschia rubra]